MGGYIKYVLKTEQYQYSFLMLTFIKITNYKLKKQTKIMNYSYEIWFLPSAVRRVTAIQFTVMLI